MLRIRKKIAYLKTSDLLQWFWQWWIWLYCFEQCVDLIDVAGKSSGVFVYPTFVICDDVSCICHLPPLEFPISRLGSLWGTGTRPPSPLLSNWVIPTPGPTWWNVWLFMIMTTIACCYASVLTQTHLSRFASAPESFFWIIYPSLF